MSERLGENRPGSPGACPSRAIGSPSFPAIQPLITGVVGDRLRANPEFQTPGNDRRSALFEIGLHEIFALFL
jgi:hypothetical protein